MRKYLENMQIVPLRHVCNHSRSCSVVQRVVLFAQSSFDQMLLHSGINWNVRTRFYSHTKQHSFTV